MENLIPDPCDRYFPVQGKVWCDDYTDIYVGNCDTLSEESLASLDYDPVKILEFELKAKCCDFIYFVCWSNDYGSNGLLAELSMGSNSPIVSHQINWEVFATGINYSLNFPRPPRNLVLTQIQKADCHHLWTKPFLGPPNVINPSPTPFAYHSGISTNAHYIWHDAGLGGSPFAGSNQDEFLIFRTAVKNLTPECSRCECEDCDCCECGCDGCNEKASEQEKKLAGRAKGKDKFIVGSGNNTSLCPPVPYSHIECKSALSIKKLDLCFYLQLTDSPADDIEDDDTEVMYLTVCNPYSNLKIKGLRIIGITLLPTQPIHLAQIVPDCFICFDCLDPCSCKSRELAFITRKVPPGAYTIEVEYCVDEVLVTMDLNGKTTFPITIVKD